MNEELQKLIDHWPTIIQITKINHTMSEHSFNIWISPLKIMDLIDNTLYLTFNNSMGADFINKRYKSYLENSIYEVLKVNYEVVIAEEKNYQEIQKSLAIEKKESEKIKELLQASNLNSKYTFDKFVIGDCNSFAVATAKQIALNPGSTNPFFLHGGAGLGKTHLIQAIGIHILNTNPKANVLYCTSETFTNELIEAIRTNKQPAFRAKYRNIDCLIIDDIQFLLDKEKVQEEFFNTFNALNGDNKQIIISSDKPPKDMIGLEERISTRFENGITLDITAPDYETRMAILKNKCDENGITFENDVLDYIAINITSNIRSLEGALNKITIWTKFSGEKMDLEHAKSILDDIISPTKPKEITLDNILETVADHYGITLDQISSKGRAKDLVHARHVYMYIARTLTTHGYKDIGRFSGLDHSTVKHGIDKITNELKTDQSLNNEIEVIKNKLSPS